MGLRGPLSAEAEGEESSKGTSEDGGEDTNENDPPGVATVGVANRNDPIVGVSNRGGILLLAGTAGVHGNERVGATERSEVGGRVGDIHVGVAVVGEGTQSLEHAGVSVGGGDDDAVGLHGEATSNVKSGREANEDEGLVDREDKISKDGNLTGDGKASSIGLGDGVEAIRAGGVGVLNGGTAGASGASRGVGGATKSGIPNGFATTARVVRTDVVDLSAQKTANQRIRSG